MITEYSVPPDLLGLPRTRAAIAYAERSHAGQRRKIDGAPFILHPLEVASLLFDAGAPDHVVAAGALHDVIEKTDADPDDLRMQFGDRVTELVLAVSEDKRIGDYTARKAALRAQVANAGDEALTLFAADKVSKVRELRPGPSPGRGRRRLPGSSSPKRRLQVAHHRGCLLMLEEALPHSTLVEQLRSELNEHHHQAA